MSWLLVTAPLTFQGAQQDCLSKGGLLATFYTADDQVWQSSDALCA